MLNLVREGEEDYIEAIRYRRRLKIFENFLFLEKKGQNSGRQSWLVVDLQIVKDHGQRRRNIVKMLQSVVSSVRMCTPRKGDREDAVVWVKLS